MTGLYIYFTLKLWKIPEEAVHFLEYGLLSFFLFKALSHHVRDKSIFLTAALFALFIGTIDEILQWVISERYWDFKDAGLNGLSGALFQLAVWRVIRPKIISENINAKSLRVFSAVLASCMILLGLCVSNTPNRVANYTKKIPWLSFLQKEEPMSEFGYKYKDPEIGVFYSRLNPRVLQRIDKQKGKEYGQILSKSIHIDYEQFIKKYNPTTQPFMHELRVHIFRRDTYFNKGKSASNNEKKKEFFLIAYKENLILKKYYTQSIKNSTYWWTDDKIRLIDNYISKDRFYESPVSATLFTAFSEKTVWITIIVLILILILLNFFLPYMKILS